MVYGYLPNTKARKVVGDVVAVRGSIEFETILGGRDVGRRGNVVGETTVLVKVDDDQTVSWSIKMNSKSVKDFNHLHVVPVRRVADSIIHVLNQLLTSRHVAGGVHRVDCAAFRVDVGEFRQSTFLKVAVELVSVDDAVHRIILNPLRAYHVNSKWKHDSKQRHLYLTLYM